MLGKVCCTIIRPVKRALRYFENESTKKYIIFVIATNGVCYCYLLQKRNGYTLSDQYLFAILTETLVCVTFNFYNVPV